MDQHEPGPHTLWPEALGLFVPLNIAAFFLLSIRRTQLQFHIGLFVVFFVSNIVVFQPWEVNRSCDCIQSTPTLCFTIMFRIFIGPERFATVCAFHAVG